MVKKKEITAIDIDIPADVPAMSEGVAYYRLTPEMKDFLSRCHKEAGGIIGFVFEEDSFNFGVIIGHVHQKYDNKQVD